MLPERSQNMALVIGGHWRSLEVGSDQSKACLDDLRGFVGWDGIGLDGMVIGYHRYSKSTFGANKRHRWRHVKGGGEKPKHLLLSFPSHRMYANARI